MISLTIALVAFASWEQNVLEPKFTPPSNDLTAFSQMLNDLELEPKDRERILLNFERGETNLWTQTSLGKSPTRLEAFLRKAYVLKTQVISGAYLNDKHLTPVGGAEAIHLIQSHLASFALTSYEKEKAESPDLLGEIEAFHESAGFLTFKSSLTNQICTLLVVGQSLKLTHYLRVLSIKAATQSFNLQFRDDEPVQRAMKIRLADREAVIVNPQDIEPFCTEAFWRASIAPPEAIEMSQIDLNYSIFRFVGLSLRHFNHEARIVLQTPSVRRGANSECRANEDKVWTFFGTHQIPSTLHGGRYFIDDQAMHPLKFFPLAGARWHTDKRQHPYTQDFTVFRWDRPANQKTLRLSESFKGSSIEGDFYKWLSLQIPTDPY